ncbi:MAG: hypothetical protein LBN05_01115 [Oscillospiraceae bacterium]|jgi:ribosomal protein S27AE|nr:hypothetical protein [Oscillospiraceae bacterium]
MALMDMTREEALLLARADRDLAFLGKTDLVCPRCGNGFAVEEHGNSYVFRCKTPGCLSETVRGI